MQPCFKLLRRASTGRKASNLSLSKLTEVRQPGIIIACADKQQFRSHKLHKHGGTPCCLRGRAAGKCILFSLVAVQLSPGDRFTIHHSHKLIRGWRLRAISVHEMPQWAMPCQQINAKVQQNSAKNGQLYGVKLEGGKLHAAILQIFNHLCNQKACQPKAFRSA